MVEKSNGWWQNEMGRRGWRTWRSLKMIDRGMSWPARE